MSDLKPHDLWQQEWSEPFVGNYEAFIDVHELYALFTDHKELQSQIDRLTNERDDARKEATNFRLRFATVGQMFRGNEYAAEIMGYKFSWE